MAGAPQFKIFNPAGDYIGCLKHLEDAAALVAILGHGAEVRDGHNKRNRLWMEGNEVFSAGNSYDGAAKIMVERIEHRRVKLAAARARTSLPA